MEKVVILQNESGLHARPAGQFVKVASKFDSEIEIEVNGNKVNAKSIMSMMGLGAAQGDEIRIIANGKDEEKAINELVELVNNKFGE